MKPFRILFAVALAVALAASSCGSTDAVAATVNGREIDRSEFERELEALAGNQELLAASGGGQGLLGQGKDTVDARLTAGWLTAVIYDALITEEFERRGLEVTEQDRGTAQAQLADQFGNPKVADAFPEWFRERLASRNARAAALRSAISGMSITEEGVREYYEEHKSEFAQVCLSHILIREEEAAREALARIRAGADFAAVASAESEDPGSGEQGGDLGCNNRGLFVPEFEEAAFSAEIGTPTDLVRTQFGYHILLVRERQTSPFEQARTQVEAALSAESEEAFRQFLTEAAGTADVSVDPRYGTFRTLEGSGAPEVVPPEVPAPAEGRPEGGVGGDRGEGPEGIPLPDEVPGDTGTPSS